MMDFLYSATALFSGVPEAEARVLLLRMNAHLRSFHKGEAVYRAGDRVAELGLLLSGGINQQIHLPRGNCQILAHIKPGELFAEDAAVLPERELRCDYIADGETEALFFPPERMFAACQGSCQSHRRLLQNYFRAMALRGQRLTAWMLHTAPRSIRERLLSYLSDCARECGANAFSIPFSRQQLADYLGVDRSALSNELSRMRADGLLQFRKNRFLLCREDAGEPQHFSGDTLMETWGFP